MILAINTSTLQFGLALLEEDGTVLAEFLMSKGESRFGGLMPALHFLLRTSKCDIREIKGLVVATGPGSFTGLRIGLSAAKGLCHALKTPIIGISSLRSMASQLLFSDLPIAPMLDSRKGEVFLAQFIWNNEGELIRIMEDVSLKFKDFSSLPGGDQIVFVGNNYARQGPLIKEILGPRALLAPVHCWCLRASAVGSLGLKRFRIHDFDDPQSLSPLYLRPPDIQLT